MRTDKDNNYRVCPYCERKIPPQYSLRDHKYICKNISK